MTKRNIKFATMAAKFLTGPGIAGILVLAFILAFSNNRPISGETATTVLLLMGIISVVIAVAYWHLIGTLIQIMVGMALELRYIKTVQNQMYDALNSQHPEQFPPRPRQPRDPADNTLHMQFSTETAAGSPPAAGASAAAPGAQAAGQPSKHP